MAMFMAIKSLDILTNKTDLTHLVIQEHFFYCLHRATLKNFKNDLLDMKFLPNSFWKRIKAQESFPFPHTITIVQGLCSSPTFSLYV